MASIGSERLKPRQVGTLDHLIALGAPRPAASEGISDVLASAIREESDAELSRWNGSGFFLSKSRYLEHLRCEGLALARASESSTPPGPAIMRGKVAHRAIQMSYTHPAMSPEGTVRAALQAVCEEDEDLSSMWENSSASTQSDILVSSVSSLTNFLDDFPPLDPSWSPRFEEPMAAKVGHLRLSVRADLTIGRPRGDDVRTILIVDFKTGQLSDVHRSEAEFYALVATLRYGVPPWRSSVFSLADGTFSEPDISEDDLVRTARSVGVAAATQSALMMESRLPALSPGDHCRFCPARRTCPDAAQT